MRRSALGGLLLFTVSALVTAVALLPLKLVLAVTAVPVQAERVEGTIWNGRIENAWIAGYPVGDVTVAGKALPLLTGRLAAKLRVQGQIADGGAVVAIGPRGHLMFKDADFVVNIAPLQLRDAFDAPMAGTVEVKSPHLVISPDACLAGELSLRTDTLQRSAARYGGEGFFLAGTGGCEAGALVLPLAGAGREGQVKAMIRISQAGYMTELVVEPADQRLVEALQLYGFQQRGKSYSLIQRGDLF